MSDNLSVKHLANQLLAKNSHVKTGISAPQAVHVGTGAVDSSPKLGLPKHLVAHAHEYVTKLMKAKGHL